MNSESIQNILFYDIKHRDGFDGKRHIERSSYGATQVLQRKNIRGTAIVLVTSLTCLKALMLIIILLLDSRNT